MRHYPFYRNKYDVRREIALDQLAVIRNYNFYSIQGVNMNFPAPHTFTEQMAKMINEHAVFLILTRCDDGFELTLTTADEKVIYKWDEKIPLDFEAVRIPVRCVVEQEQPELKESR